MATDCRTSNLQTYHVVCGNRSCLWCPCASNLQSITSSAKFFIIKTYQKYQLRTECGANAKLILLNRHNCTQTAIKYDTFVIHCVSMSRVTLCRLMTKSLVCNSFCDVYYTIRNGLSVCHARQPSNQLWWNLQIIYDRRNIENAIAIVYKSNTFIFMKTSPFRTLRSANRSTIRTRTRPLYIVLQRNP